VVARSNSDGEDSLTSSGGFWNGRRSPLHLMATIRTAAVEQQEQKGLVVCALDYTFNTGYV
jgi:hypothetical protein